MADGWCLARRLPSGASVAYRTLRWRDLLPGAITLGVLLVTTAATLKFARIGSLHGRTVRYYAAFASARNVMGGTEVWISGTKVGRVKGVHFAPPTANPSSRVIVEFEVLEKYRDQIRENSVARLGTGSRVMGPTTLGVTVGSPDARVVPRDDTIRGIPGGDVQTLTSSYGDVAKEIPDLIANVKVLSSSLASARGTIGALTTLDAPRRFETLLGNASRFTERAMAGGGTLGLALQRGQLIARAKAATAQADSVRLLLASDRSSFGRFRRDSTLLRTVADLRDELSITTELLSSQNGSLARFGQDSIIAVQTAEMSRQMTELVADIKKRPFRYIAF
jgi:phospholipid/cholesterol/gamma-HCH transport system substrate-binding protein